MIQTQSGGPVGGSVTGAWVLGLRPSGTTLAGVDVVTTLLELVGALAACAVLTVLILFGAPAAFAVLPAEGSLRCSSVVWISLVSVVYPTWISCSPVWRYV